MQAAKISAALHQQWMAYSHSLFSWLASGLFLITITGGLVAPFVLVIVAALHLSKREWLPKDDAYLLKPLNYWFNCCLIAFAAILLGRALDTLGFL